MPESQAGSASGWAQEAAAAPSLPELQQRYTDLRESMETLLAQPEKDMPTVDRLVDELEHVQLLIKSVLGIAGNNPRE